METYRKNRSFKLEFNVIYNDTLAQITLSGADINDVTIEIRHKKSKTALVTRKLSLSEVTLISSDVTKNCSILINKTDTADVNNLDIYEQSATVNMDVTGYTGNVPDFSNKWTDAFILEE